MFFRGGGKLCSSSVASPVIEEALEESHSRLVRQISGFSWLLWRREVKNKDFLLRMVEKNCVHFLDYWA